MDWLETPREPALGSWLSPFCSPGAGGPERGLQCRAETRTGSQDRRPWPLPCRTQRSRLGPSPTESLCGTVVARWARGSEEEAHSAGAGQESCLRAGMGVPAGATGHEGPVS